MTKLSRGPCGVRYATDNDELPKDTAKIRLTLVPYRDDEPVALNEADVREPILSGQAARVVSTMLTIHMGRIDTDVWGSAR